MGHPFSAGNSGVDCICGLGWKASGPKWTQSNFNVAKVESSTAGKLNNPVASERGILQRFFLSVASYKE